MKTLCGAECSNCNLYNKKCKGCIETNACPFDKKCWIAKYIEIGGNDSFNQIKNDLINEINSLNIDGVPKIDELYPLQSSFINLEYMLPNGKKEKLLDDSEAYLGNQVECVFNDEDIKQYFGIVANMNFIMISSYEEDNKNQQLIIYKKR